MPKPRKHPPKAKYLDISEAAALASTDIDADPRELAEVEKALALSIPRKEIARKVFEIWGEIRKLKPVYQSSAHNVHVAPPASKQHEAMDRIADDVRKLEDTFKALDSLIRSTLAEALGEIEIVPMEFVDAQERVAKTNPWWRGEIRLRRLEQGLARVADVVPVTRSRLGKPTRGARSLASAPLRHCARELALARFHTLDLPPTLATGPGSLIALLKVAMKIWGAPGLKPGKLLSAARNARDDLHELSAQSPALTGLRRKPSRRGRKPSDSDLPGSLITSVW